MAESEPSEIDQKIKPVEVALARPSAGLAKHWPAAELADHLQQRLVAERLDVTFKFN